jgi:hypothetical protein
MKMAKLGKTTALMMLAALMAAPLVAAPTDSLAASCKTRKLNGTLLGAAGGALVGGAVTHGSTGPIVGGLAGAVVGREVGRNGCTPRRAYYRSSSRPAYYRSSGTRYAEPRPVERKVYYDERGRPVTLD